jgi:arylsulfatase A-like enzyme
LHLRRFVVVACLAACAACRGPAHPNILLLVMDTARADRFTWSGSQRALTPALTDLARESTVYTQAFSPAPWTVPAHASLFTGRYPSLHGTDCGSLRLPDSEQTLAELLHEAGYRTVGYTGNPWLGSTYNFQQGFDTYGETWREVTAGTEDSGAAITNAKVERFLSWRRDNPDASHQPFFLFLNYFEAHLPYHPPQPERGRWLRPGIGEDRVARLSRLGHPDEMRFILGLSDLTPDDLLVLGDLYDGEIAYVDQRAGEVIGLIRRLGLLDNTIVAVLSDHGENLGEHHLLDHKMSVHATLLRVPMLLRYPPQMAAGKRIETPVQIHDLFPTLLSLAGVRLPDGVVVEARMLPGAGHPEEERKAEEAIVGEFAGPPIEFLQVMRQTFPGSDLSRFDRTLVALRQDGYTIHWGSDGRHSLYGPGDPGETLDLAASDSSRLRRMTESVEAWMHRPAREAARARSRTAP